MNTDRAERNSPKSLINVHKALVGLRVRRMRGGCIAYALIRAVLSWSYLYAPLESIGNRGGEMARRNWMWIPSSELVTLTLTEVDAIDLQRISSSD
jgi:hypothetical protein